jgi:hypothetical protein
MTYRNYLRKRKIEVSDALISLCPNSSWSVDDTYESIQNYFSEDYPLPTKEKVITEIERLQKISDDFEYQRLRAKEYPSFADQFDLLYHGGYDAWKTEIDKIKEKYPKP